VTKKDWRVDYEETVQALIHECVWADKDGKKGILIICNADAVGVLGLNSSRQEAELMLSTALSSITEAPDQKDLH
jgi:hypothetical protein